MTTRESEITVNKSPTGGRSGLKAIASGTVGSREYRGRWAQRWRATTPRHRFRFGLFGMDRFSGLFGLTGFLGSLRLFGPGLGVVMPAPVLAPLPVVPERPEFVVVPELP
jgi:hypothetical protein